MQEAGLPREAILPILESARELVASDTPMNLQANILLSLSYFWLYETGRAPENFQRAIDAGEQALRTLQGVNLGGFYVNLACAYGQKAAWLLNVRKLDQASEEFQNARGKAFEHLEAALRENPARRARIRDLLRPPAGADDDDLAVFGTDPEFMKLVGISI
jgi:hypothetical protein